MCNLCCSVAEYQYEYDIGRKVLRLVGQGCVLMLRVWYTGNAPTDY